MSIFYLKRDHFNLKCEIHGNPKGIPILFLHGGPGYRCDTSYLEFFDLNKYQVIFINQRGSSGNDEFVGDLNQNTTWKLIEDVEHLRIHLKLSTWQVYGQSWGSTLALCYAIKHPTVISKLFLKGIFLAREKDINWIYSKDGLINFSKKTKEKYNQLFSYMKIPKNQNLLSFYYNKIIKKDLPLSLEHLSWAIWEDINCSSYSANLDDHPTLDQIFLSNIPESLDFKKVCYAISRIEVFFFKHKCFLPKNFILKNLKRISCPIVIIQGNEDKICPQYQAKDLFNQLKKNKKKVDLFLLKKEGHSITSKKVYNLINKNLMISRIKFFLMSSRELF